MHRVKANLNIPSKKGTFIQLRCFPRLPLDGRPSTVGGSAALSAPEAAHWVSHPITGGSAGRSVPEYHTCPPPLCLHARGNKVSHTHNAMRLNPVNTQCRVAVSIWRFLKKTKSTQKVELCRWRLYVNAGGRRRGVKDAARWQLSMFGTLLFEDASWALFHMQTCTNGDLKTFHCDGSGSETPAGGLDRLCCCCWTAEL